MAHGSDDRAAAGGYLERALALAFDSDSLAPELREGPALEVKPPERAGRFLILAEIARGGGGVVYRAHDPELHRDVALKILHRRSREPAAARDRFRREVQVSGQLQHPCFVPVHESGTLAGGEPFYVMRLVEGSTLAELLRDSAVSQQRFLVVLEQVAQAVGYAHSRGFVHRDLKPSNIMVGAFGEVQVMDWGLAKLLAGERPEERAQAVMGTPSHMPPEQARGATELMDERADVFALGAILCQILTGEPPFLGDRAEALRQASEAQLRPALERLAASGAEADLISLAQRSLAEEVDDRPRDAIEFAAALTAHFARLAERMRQAELAAEAGRVEAREERRRRRLSAALFGVLSLAILGGAAVQWDRRREERARVAALSAEVREAHRAAFEAFVRAESTGAVDPLAWDRAELEIERAANLLDSGEVLDGLPDRVRALADLIGSGRADALEAERRRERDRDMLDRLGRVHVSLATSDYDMTRAGYGEAFANYGIDWFEPVPEAARDSEIADELARAFDRWALSAYLHGQGLNGGMDRGEVMNVMLERASELDVEPKRRSIRRALQARDLSALKNLAATEDLRTFEPETSALLAAGLRLAGAFDDAERVLKQGLAAHPADCWLNFWLGNLIMDRHGRNAEGLLYAYAALGCGRDSYSARHLIGELYQRDGQHEEALVHFELLTDLHPNEGHYQAHLAVILNELDRGSEALDCARRGVELSPENAHAWSTLAGLEQIHGRRRASLAAARRAYALDPSTQRIRSMVSALMAVDLYEEALPLCAQLLEPKSDSTPYTDPYNVSLDWYLYARLLEDTAELEVIEGAFREALSHYPDFPEAHCGLAHTLEQRGDFEGALRHYLRGHELGSARENWTNPSGEWVEQSELFVRSDGRFEAFRAGEFEPSGGREANQLGLLASWRGCHTLAVQTLESAAVRWPELANDYRGSLIESLIALCADADRSVTERLGWGRRALDALCAQLNQLRFELWSEPEVAFGPTLGFLRVLERRRTFADLRDPEALEALRALGSEGAALARRAEAFWADVAAQVELVVALELALEG